MNLVGGSYRKCIGKDCAVLPTIVFDIKGETRQSRYTIMILSCSQHETEAQTLRTEKYASFPYQRLENPKWLKGAQESELARKKETL